MLEGNARGAGGIDGEFHTHVPVANITGYARYLGGNRSELRPREAFEPNDGMLRRTDFTQCVGRLKLGNHFEASMRQDHAELLAFGNMDAGPQCGAFAQPARYRGANEPLCDVVFKAANVGRGNRHISLNFGDIAENLPLMQLAIALADLLLRSKPQQHGVEALRGGAFSFRIGQGTLGIRI